MDALAAHAATLSTTGTAFAGTGARIHAGWQNLGAVYHAPEAGQLLAATGPVATVSASVGEDITAAGGALATYATEVAAIKTRLESLRAQAVTFVDTVASTEDWRDDQGDVDRHNQLVSGVNAAVADFMDAQRRCANTILALYTDRRYTADNGDDTVLPTEFGYTAAQLDAAVGQDGALPWGTAEDHDRGFWGDVGAFFGGAGDSLVGMVTGLGALIGYSEGHWSWSTAGTAWKGLGTFAVALSVYSNPAGVIMDQTTGYGPFGKGELGDTLLGAGKALIAYDEWGQDKSRAAGMATTNVITAILGTKGAGAGLRGTGAALQASRFTTVAHLGTGLTRAGEAIGALPTARDVLAGIRARFPALHVPRIELPHTDLPPTRVDAPTPHAPEPARIPDAPAIADDVARADDAPSDTPGTDPTPDATGGPDASPAGGSGIDAAPGPDPAPALPPGVDPPLVRSEPLPTRELQERYRGENDPTNPNRAFYPRTVTYMSPQQLEAHRVVVTDGNLSWAADGSHLDTSAAATWHSGQGRAMFVMDEHGNLYVSLEQRVGELHHSSFLGGAPVAGAGELVVQNGDVTIITRKSGHYRPTEAQQQTVADVLAEQGVDVSRIEFGSGF